MTDISKLIGDYIDLRDKLKLTKRKFNEFENDTKTKLNMIEADILAFQDSVKLESVSSARGTAFKVKKEFYRLNDWDTFIAYIVKTKNYQMLEKRVAKIATKEVIDEKDMDPADIGINYSAEWKIHVRCK